MTRPDVVDPTGWVIAVHAMFGLAANDDTFGLSRTGVGAAGVPYGVGARAQVGYRAGWVGLDLDLAYHALGYEEGPGVPRPPSQWLLHGVFTGGDFRLWLYTNGPWTVSIGLGGGLSTWFSPFLVDPSGTPQRVNGVWTPYAFGDLRVSLAGRGVGFSITTDARTMLGMALDGSQLWSDPLVICGLGVGLWFFDRNDEDVAATFTREPRRGPSAMGSCGEQGEVCCGGLCNGQLYCIARRCADPSRSSAISAAPDEAAFDPSTREAGAHARATQLATSLASRCESREEQACRDVITYWSRRIRELTSHQGRLVSMRREGSDDNARVVVAVPGIDLATAQAAISALWPRLVDLSYRRATAADTEDALNGFITEFPDAAQALDAQLRVLELTVVRLAALRDVAALFAHQAAHGEIASAEPALFTILSESDDDAAMQQFVTVFASAASTSEHVAAITARREHVLFVHARSDGDHAARVAALLDFALQFRSSPDATLVPDAVYEEASAIGGWDGAEALARYYAAFPTATHRAEAAAAAYATASAVACDRTTVLVRYAVARDGVSASLPIHVPERVAHMRWFRTSFPGAADLVSAAREELECVLAYASAASTPGDEILGVATVYGSELSHEQMASVRRAAAAQLVHDDGDDQVLGLFADVFAGSAEARHARQIVARHQAQRRADEARAEREAARHSRSSEHGAASGCGAVPRVACLCCMQCGGTLNPTTGDCAYVDPRCIPVCIHTQGDFTPYAH